ncbi:hypothetical protein FO519_005441 [Halicephalobus sp. NKZ332]|nr:hypothetical protein FO519_005441 [Halicephalobus sp. NKZ332]
MGVFAITYGLQAYYTYCVRTKDYLPTAETLRRLFGDEEGKVSATGISGIFDYYLYIALGHSSILITGSYSIVIFCSWEIYKFMKLHKDSVHISVDIQKQLTKTLIIQALIPLFTFCVPVSAMIVALVLPVTVPEFIFALLGLSLSYIPLGNGLSMLFYVKSYRMFVVNLFKRGCRLLFGAQSSATVNPLESNISDIP